MTTNTSVVPGEGPRSVEKASEVRRDGRQPGAMAINSSIQVQFVDTDEEFPQVTTGNFPQPRSSWQSQTGRGIPSTAHLVRRAGAIVVAPIERCR